MAVDVALLVGGMVVLAVLLAWVEKRPHDLAGKSAWPRLSQCPCCGKQLGAAARFCGQCGHRLYE